MIDRYQQYTAHNIRYGVAISVSVFLVKLYVLCGVYHKLKTYSNHTRTKLYFGWKI